MNKPTIGILGASGFVGSALVERLYFDETVRDRYTFTAFIHSFGNAARLTRLPIRIERLDLLDSKAVESALTKCDFVVNCTRGSAPLMLDGLKNLIRGMKKVGTKKFVHLGSVAIYGEDPAPETASEDAPPGGERTDYGDLKATQDELVFALHQGGVPSMILCPSNIGGPYSSLIVDAVRMLQERQIVLVDGGRNATNIVHVDNLVQAIVSALASDSGWGERYFVNETEPTTWRQFFADLVAMMGIDYEFEEVSREDVVRAMASADGARAKGIKSQLGTLVSRDFRDALSVVPAIGKLDAAAMGLFNRLSPGMQESLRAKLRKPITIREARLTPALGHKLVTTQIRGVYHAPAKIVDRLDFKPLLDYRDGMTTTRRWLEFANLIPAPDSARASRAG